MFSSARSFNQPVEAWDVGQVTNMWVRRRPASWSQGSCTHTPLWGPQAVCVCWCRAEHVLLRELLQQARGSLGRRPGFHHECAPLPYVSIWILAHTQLLRTAAKQPARVLVWSSICSPPRAPSTSPWKHGMLARSRPCMCAAALRQGHRAPAHTHAALGATSRVCVCWRGAGDVLLRKRFQPACGCLEC